MIRLVNFLIIGFAFCLNYNKHISDAIKEKDFAPKNFSHSASTIYTEVEDLKEQSDFNQENAVQKLDINYQDLSIKIRYISERSYISIENNSYFIDWTPFLINFTYDMSYADAQEGIHLLLKDNNTSNGYLLFPAYTEEYDTYFLYFFNENTFQYLGAYESINFEKGSFSYDDDSQKLYLSSNNKTSELIQLEEYATYETNDFVEEDKKLLADDNLPSNDSNIQAFIENDHYFIIDLDLNKDGISDKTASHNRYQGDELWLFLGNEEGEYQLSLKTINFSEDGGNQISQIKETKQGFMIVTSFPYRGYLEKNYYISFDKGQYTLNKVIEKSKSGQGQLSKTKICEYDFDISLTKNPTPNLVPTNSPNCIFE